MDGLLGAAADVQTRMAGQLEGVLRPAPGHEPSLDADQAALTSLANQIRCYNDRLLTINQDYESMLERMEL